MPGLKFCNHQEECQLVLGAVEAKVKLQTELAVQRKEWEAKRAIMNSLYLAAVKRRIRSTSRRAPKQTSRPAGCLNQTSTNSWARSD